MLSLEVSAEDWDRVSEPPRSPQTFRERERERERVRAEPKKEREGRERGRRGRGERVGEGQMEERKATLVRKDVERVNAKEDAEKYGNQKHAGS